MVMIKIQFRTIFYINIYIYILKLKKYIYVLYKVINIQSNEAVYKFNETKVLNWLNKKVNILLYIYLHIYY